MRQKASFKNEWSGRSTGSFKNDFQSFTDSDSRCVEIGLLRFDNQDPVVKVDGACYYDLLLSQSFHTSGFSTSSSFSKTMNDPAYRAR